MLWLLKRLKYRVVFLHFCIVTVLEKKIQTQKQQKKDKDKKKTRHKNPARLCFLVFIVAFLFTQIHLAECDIENNK